MNKDVIYIDVEDDITAIIGKVKQSKDKVVALVPPKRIGVLQSAVNLRLLARAAKQSDKHLAVVTNNHALMALAAAASIPVAKNLQSKPELAEVPALQIDDEDDDIIEGSELPIGEHAKQATSADDAKDTKDAAMAAALAEAPAGDETPKKPKVKSGKVPNFNTFRKRLILAIVAVLLLIGFAVWAIFIAPRATIVIKAKTTSTSINAPVTLAADKSTNFASNTIKAAMQQKVDKKTVDFQATGQKDNGSKAAGTVQFSNGSVSDVNVPAGTQLKSSSGLVFTTDQGVTVPAAGLGNCNGQACVSNGHASVGITAAENGSKYNGATGSMSGAPAGITANITQTTSGGLTKMVTVVSAADVQKAKQSVADENTDSVKNDLKSKFPKDTTVIDESFQVDYGDVASAPDVGQEAGTAKLSVTITYKLYGVAKSEVSTFLDAFLKQQLSGKAGQRVYKNGSDKIVLQDVSQQANGAKATLIATAQVGPEIKNDDVKNIAKGKRYGEIQQNLESIQGIESVDVKFFPFWVSTVPNDNSRITVEFNINGS